MNKIENEKQMHRLISVKEVTLNPVIILFHVVFMSY